MNKEADQTQESKRRHKYREDLDPEKLDWLIWLSHNAKWYFAVKPNLRFKFHTMASPNQQKRMPRSKLVDNVLVGEIKMEVNDDV